MDVTNQPSLITLPNPYDTGGRTFTIAAFLPGETLGRYVERNEISLPRSVFIVQHNGRRVPIELWDRLIPRTGDQIVIRAVPQGGGGGGKVLRTVAMIAVIAVSIMAPYMAPAAWGMTATVGGITSVTMGGALLSAGIMIAGTLMVNAFLPPPAATAAQIGQGSKYESSPTYAISGGRNRMRLWEPMTIIFGRHKIVPDLGAKYYTEFVGDDQYLNQCFHFGLQAGSIAITDYKIGDTPIANYQGVQLEASSNNGRLSMFPGNVDTLQGFALASGVVNSRTTALDVTYISVELASQLFYVRDDGGIDGRSVQIRVQYRPVGGAWADIGMLNDAIYATHYWALMKVERYQVGDSGEGTREIQVSYGSVNAGDHTDGDSVVIEPGWTGGAGDNEYYVPPVMGRWRWKPHPFRLSQPWQGIAPDPLIGYSTVPGIRLYGARQEPTRQTVGWAVAKGQYEIRVWKESPDIKSSRESNESAVSQILAYQTDEAGYTGQQRLALRIKATSQLNGAVDELNAIGQVYCAVWNGSAWTWSATSNPAWSFLWFARGLADPNTGERICGAGLDDSQIDIEAIKAWGLWCDAKGLTFDYVLDRKISTAQVLQMIARAGRASPTWQTGKLGVVWDAANLPVTAMFGPFNIKAGSFKVAYINDGTADEIVLNFINPARNWAMDEVRVKVPGATTTNNPLQLDFDGCVNPVMAGKEANLLAASQVWHRRRVTWETDIEGWVAGRGDVVQMSHDLTVWGYSGRLFGRAGNAITLDKDIPSGGSGALMIRGPENQMKVVTVSSGVGDVDLLTITTDMTGFPLPGDEGYEGVPTVDWAWFFDPLATPGRRFKITEVQPSEDGVKFTAIDDDPEYYASENNPYAYMPPRDGLLLGGVVFGITFTETLVNVQADITNVQIGWALSTSMKVQVVASVNGQAQPVINTEDRSITVQAQTGDVVSVTVTPTPATGGSGTPGTQQYVVQGLTAPLPAVTGLTNVFRDGLTALVWNRVVDIRQPEYEIRIGPSWINSRPVGIVPTLDALAVGNGLYWVAARFASRGFVVYGPADSLSISGATLVRNVLATVNEHPGWDGTLGNGAIINEGLLTLAGTGDFLAAPDVLALDDVLWYGGVVSGGTYQTATSNIIDIGYATPVRIDFQMEEYALNFGENFLTIPDVLTYADVLSVSNRQHYKVRPQLRHAQDDGVFGDWQDYIPGLINARYFDVRLLLETEDPLLIPFVSAFTWTIDVPDLVQQGIEITVPVTGLRITYPKEFHTDDVSPQIAIYDAQNNSRARFFNTSRTGFDIELLDNTTPIEGKINWLSQRY